MVTAPAQAVLWPLYNKSQKSAYGERNYKRKISQMSENPGFYTPQQVTETLGIPPSTLRRYAKEYKAFLGPDASKRGRKRRYTERDLLILAEIRELYSKRLSADEIRDTLQVFDPNQAAQDRPGMAMIPAARFQEAIDRIEGGIRGMAETQERFGHELQGQDNRLANVESTVQSLRLILYVLTFIIVAGTIIYLVILASN